MAYKRLKDLKKGDKVYYAFLGHYLKGDDLEEKIVKSVKTNGDVTIVRVEYESHMWCSRFVGYSTGTVALSAHDTVISASEWEVETLQCTIERMENQCNEKVDAAIAIKSMANVFRYIKKITTEKDESD